MSGELESRRMLGRLFETAGLNLSDSDLDIVSRLHESFAGQRSRLAGAARPESEPMIVATFDRGQTESKSTDEATG